MAINARRRFRRPVFSRLTLAWTFFVCAGAAFSVYALVAGDDAADEATRVALAFDGDIEIMAPPVMRSVLPGRGKDSIGPAPALREGAASDEPFFTETKDALASADPDWIDDPYAEQPRLEQPGDIVITIDGAPALNAGARALQAQTASLTRSTVRIAEPEAALLQKTPLGAIPKIAADGRKAARVYAHPFAADDDAKRVAVILGGLGLNRTLTERAIVELPPEITLAFAPYAKDLDYWTARAREAGHEIMLELPMEGYGEDAERLGPAALLTTRAPAENLQRLDWLLGRFAGYFAATNYQGGKFAADNEAMTAVMARLNALGVAYVDDTGAARRVLAADSDAAIVNRMIAAGDASADAKTVRKDLAALESMAARNGGALGKAYVYDASLAAIGEWAAGLAERDVSLAPASSLVTAR